MKLKAEFILDTGDVFKLYYSQKECDNFVSSMIDDFEESYKNQYGFWIGKYDDDAREMELWLNERKLKEYNYTIPTDKIIAWNFQG